LPAVHIRPAAVSKYSGVDIRLSMILTTLYLLTACVDEKQEIKRETFKNPVDTYMDSRMDALENAKAAAAESNKEQEEAMKALLK